MTSLAVAVARDSRGPAALYLMTDSRITWATATEHWDAGRKTFASSVGADVFGYCGDAYFMPMTLGQILSMAAAGVVDLNSPSAKQRHDLVLSLLANSLSMIQTRHALPMTLFHGARDGEHMLSRFRLWRSHFDPKSMSWSEDELTVGDRSYLAAIDGSGGAQIRKFEKEAASTGAAGTSRAAIHAFCNSLHSGGDQFSGGAPQLVGLWRKGHAREFGVCWHGKFFIAGMQVPDSLDRQKVDWFNHLFERCDGRTGRRLVGSPGHRLALSTPAAATK
ncbi:MAG: hypothetical protein WD942_11370 [Dehalococcoidia bacterium]